MTKRILTLGVLCLAFMLIVGCSLPQTSETTETTSTDVKTETKTETKTNNTSKKSSTGVQTSITILEE